MKIFSFIVLIVLSTMACKKETKVSQPEPFKFIYYGTVSALRNGIPWTAEITCGFALDSEMIYTIGITTFSPDNYRRENLVFLNIPFYTLTDTLQSWEKYSYGNRTSNRGLFASYIRFYNEGYSSSGQYNLLTEKRKSLQIVNYNDITKEINGTFDVGFATGDGSFKDTAIFTDGKFYTKIQKRIYPDE